MLGKPKEDVFYTMFREFGDKIVEAAEEYAVIMGGYPETAARIPQMKVYERECDEKVQHIMKELYASFVTPFEREDISDLALRLDDIVDGMNSVAERLDLFNVDDTRKEATQLAELTLRACKTVQEMLSVLSDYKKDPTVMEKLLLLDMLKTRVTLFITMHSLVCSAMRCLVAIPLLGFVFLTVWRLSWILVTTQLELSAPLL